MNILHIIIGLGVGGAENALSRLIGSHEENNRFSHSVISLTTVGEMGERLRARGVCVQALGMRSFLDLPRTLWTLRRLIQEQRPNIVQTWMYHADLLGGIAAHLAGCKTVAWGVRSTDILTGTSHSTRVIRRLCAYLSDRIPRVIVCAADASARAHRAMGYDSNRMIVIPNGFDTTQSVNVSVSRAKLRASIGYSDGDLVVGTVGRFNPYKDHGNFVRAAGLLADRFDRVRFLMVGRGLDDSNAKLRAWIQQAGHSDRFVLLGDRNDVSTCLAAMDVFCLSSRSEGFPNVVGEAMAMGLPCVATDVGDVAKLIGLTGIIVPKENPQALADGLSRMLNLPAKSRTALGIEAKKRIEANFSARQTRELFEHMYDCLVSSPVNFG